MLAIVSVALPLASRVLRWLTVTLPFRNRMHKVYVNPRSFGGLRPPGCLGWYSLSLTPSSARYRSVDIRYRYGMGAVNYLGGYLFLTGGVPLK